MNFGVIFFAVLTQVVFWVLYTQTGTLFGSIGITAGIAISLSGVLWRLGKIKQH